MQERGKKRKRKRRKMRREGERREKRRKTFSCCALKACQHLVASHEKQRGQGNEKKEKQRE